MALAEVVWIEPWSGPPAVCPDAAATGPGGHVRLLVLPWCERLTWAGQGEERFHTFCSGFISFSGK